MSSLTLNGVGKVYPSGTTALYDISLKTGDKEFVVIVGGEKSGKTSLLRVIAGLEEVTSGTIAIDDKDVTEVEPKDRDIAMVFRGDTLYQALTVYDNMAFGLKLRKTPQALIDKRVKAAANILGLTDVLYRKPKILPAATRRRVEIGRAMVREPKLYLFDEPLAGIDENLRRDVLNVIINLQARVNGTFIYATKNLSEALTIGTRLIVLKNGLIQQIDSPSNLYDYPANTYVAFFIGAPSINFIHNATVAKEGEKYVLLFDGGKLSVAGNIAARFKAIADYAEQQKPVIIGIRPEDMKVVSLKEGSLGATFVKSEEDGGAVYAECTLSNDLTFVASCDGEFQKGKEVGLSVNLEKIYIFDSKTRLTLLERDGGYVKTGFEDADKTPLPYEDELRVIDNLKPKNNQQKNKK